MHSGRATHRKRIRIRCARARWLAPIATARMALQRNSSSCGRERERYLLPVPRGKNADRSCGNTRRWLKTAQTAITHMDPTIRGCWRSAPRSSVRAVTRRVDIRALPYDADGLATGTPSQYLLGQSCLNCHAQVHGSNHPSGSKLMR